MEKKSLSSLPQLTLLVLSLISITVPSCTSRSTEPVAAPIDKAAVPDLIARADKDYEQREDLTRVREGVALLRRARTADFQNYDVAWKLAQFNYYLGAHTKDEDERDNAFREGVEAGEAAVKLQEGKPEGHFWHGANMGGQAQASALSGLADAEDIRREMETVIKLDEGYQGGSAYMVLGQIFLELPRMMGGDPKEAVKILEKGLSFGENNALLRLRLGEAYLATGRKEDARKQLEFLISMTPRPNYIPEHKEAVEEARKLLDTRFK